MFKKILGLVLAGSITLSIAAPQTFANDISNHQMKTELTYWANKGVILPDSKGNYNPNKVVTRGEFASYIARALELPTSTKYKFSDVKGSQLIREVQAAAGAGILSGYPDGTFRPNDKITRQQMAGMLYNALKYLDVPLEEATVNFKDKDRIFYSFTKGVATSVHYDIIRGDSSFKDGIYFKPKDSATIGHAAAFLYRMYFVAEDLKDDSEVEPAPTPTPTPTPTPDTSFYVATISKGNITKNSAKYSSFEQANSAYGSSYNLVYQGDKIVKMSSGLAYAAKTTDRTTSVYATKDFKNQISYAAEGEELKYIGTGINDNNQIYVIVKIADAVGYAKLSDVTLVPTSLIEGQNDYSVSNGMLTHKVYNQLTKKAGRYDVGPAPSFMVPGVTYYSTDGVHFYNSSNQLVGTYYPYFQFASVRQPSNYTADELNAIINSELAKRQAMGGDYVNATSTSKLIGLGPVMKEMEEKYHVNALFILAAAIHESNFGMSDKAHKINNLFGIAVYDHDVANAGTKYDSPADSVRAFVNNVLNVGYIPQGNYKSQGAVPGNKTTGINVNYASDPYWGAKIAGHMYRIDTTNGNKDYGKGRLAMIVNNQYAVNVRTEPYVGATTLSYSYKVKNLGESGEFGYPVVIVDETTGTDGYIWYKVYSDAKAPADYVWVRSDNVNVLPGY
ncbi:S-layer homology domain-containing protein [Ureibacillus composti]